MPTLLPEGNVTAICPGCNGSKSTFEWTRGGSAFGGFHSSKSFRIGTGTSNFLRDYRLFRCAGCGRGGLGVVIRAAGNNYPGGLHSLEEFYPGEFTPMKLPADVPDGIRREFEEAEKCLANQCHRAAAGLFRSVLDKVMRENGYKLKKGTPLEQQIDLAAEDGVIAESRRKRAHEEIRVLGNDVLHDEWQEIPEEDVQLSRHYCQRILEDFYDDRPTVEAQLTAKKRLPLATPPPPTS